MCHIHFLIDQWKGAFHDNNHEKMQMDGAPVLRYFIYLYFIYYFIHKYEWLHCKVSDYFYKCHSFEGKTLLQIIGKT